MISVRVEGLDQLRRTLTQELPRALQGKALAAALTRAAQPILKEARVRAPVASGKLKRAIYSAKARGGTPARQTRVIGVRSGKRYGTKDAYYWKWVEFGRGEVVRKRGSLGTPAKGFFGKAVKAVPARPFLRPAFEGQKMKALEVFRQSLAGEIEKISQRRGVR